MSALVSASRGNPTREDFAALLDESYGNNDAFEGTVVKGTIVAIEKDVAVIDIGLKTEGRVALKEFTGPNREAAPGVGDVVAVTATGLQYACAIDHDATTETSLTCSFDGIPAGSYRLRLRKDCGYAVDTWPFTVHLPT